LDTAVETATRAIDALHSTAEAHQRVMIVEVMGRTAGWIALRAGIAGGAETLRSSKRVRERRAVSGERGRLHGTRIGSRLAWSTGWGAGK